MSDTLELTRELIAKQSITPKDAGCQDLLIEKLQKAHFTIEPMVLQNGVRCFWATHGVGEPVFIFAGHTDVVPTGELSQWHSPPFTPTEKEGYLYGRGAADMKSGLAAMITAALRFVNEHPQHPGQIGFIVTSDEEYSENQGTAHIVKYLQQQQIPLTYCIVGEATSQQQLADEIKIGRRGSMHGHLTILGKQGHIAYPQLARNPIHDCLKAFEQLTATSWDQGNDYFQPTSLQFYAINAGVGASNVIPGSLKAQCNFRFAPIHTATELQTRFQQILDEHQLKYQLEWQVSSQPYFAGDKQLAQYTRQAIAEICKITPRVTTQGGTSDGRYIAPSGCEVVELGPVNQSIHQINEHVKINDLEVLSKIYQRILELSLTP